MLKTHFIFVSTVLLTIATHGCRHYMMDRNRLIKSDEDISSSELRKYPCTLSGEYLHFSDLIRNFTNKHPKFKLFINNIKAPIERDIKIISSKRWYRIFHPKPNP